MAISIGTLRPEDRELRHRLGLQAFGSTGEYQEEHNLPDDRFVAVYDDDELVASSVLIEGGHWFGGKPVDGPGISGVWVAAHRRGTGVAKPMLEAVVRRLHEEGAAISGLLPTTAAYYRGAGWELAGDWIVRKTPIEVFSRTTRADADIEPFEIADLPELAPSYDAIAAQSNGHVVRGDRWWWFRQRNYSRGQGQGYLLRARVGDAEGYVTLRAAESEHRIMDLWITDIGAEDPHVLRALGGLVARFGTVTGLVKTTQPSWILEALTPEGQRWTTSESFGWMMRIVDVPKAFAQRGWAPISGELTVTLTDPVLEHNTGSFVLHFDGGNCVAEPTDAVGVQLSIQALASWYTGWKTASQLAFLGDLAGADEGTIALMDGLVTGPLPVTPEFY